MYTYTSVKKFQNNVICKNKEQVSVHYWRTSRYSFTISWWKRGEKPRQAIVIFQIVTQKFILLLSSSCNWNNKIACRLREMDIGKVRLLPTNAALVLLGMLCWRKRKWRKHWVWKKTSKIVKHVNWMYKTRWRGIFFGYFL